MHNAYTINMQNHVENVDKIYSPDVSLRFCQEIFENFHLK